MAAVTICSDFGAQDNKIPLLARGPSSPFPGTGGGFPRLPAGGPRCTFPSTAPQEPSVRGGGWGRGSRPGRWWPRGVGWGRAHVRGGGVPTVAPAVGEAHGPGGAAALLPEDLKLVVHRTGRPWGGSGVCRGQPWPGQAGSRAPSLAEPPTHGCRWGRRGSSRPRSAEPCPAWTTVPLAGSGYQEGAAMPPHLLIVAAHSCPGTVLHGHCGPPRKGGWAAGTHRRTGKRGTRLLRGHHHEPIPVLLTLVRHTVVSRV